MINITLEINRKCNLRCSYCYITDKNNEEMTLETAQKSVDFAIEKIISMNHKNRKIVIDFLGGEPLLNFNLIKNIVDYCEEQTEIVNIKFKYVMTTNGTIFNRDILEFLTKKDFSLKISIDGNQNIHDLTRKDIFGNGSFHMIKQNLHLFGEYENRTQKFIQVSNVLTKNNYRFYLETIQFLVETFGFRYIDTGMNSFEEWSDKEWEELEKILSQVLEYYLKCYDQGKEFIWNYLENSLESFENIWKLYSCGAGIISFYISYNGTYYLCPTLMDEKYSLGDVNDKDNITLFMKNIMENARISKIQNTKCSSCKIELNCKAKGCFAASVLENDSIHLPSVKSCTMNKMLNQFIGKNYFRIKKTKENSSYILVDYK